MDLLSRDLLRIPSVQQALQQHSSRESKTTRKIAKRFGPHFSPQSKMNTGVICDSTKSAEQPASRQKSRREAGESSTNTRWARHRCVNKQMLCQRVLEIPGETAQFLVEAGLS